MQIWSSLSCVWKLSSVIDGIFCLFFYSWAPQPLTKSCRRLVYRTYHPSVPIGILLGLFDSHQTPAMSCYLLCHM
ncbi:hypothetical protein FKM82_008797 [Ascaphus truei]